MSQWSESTTWDSAAPSSNAIEAESSPSLLFKVGDKAVYPSQGIVEVVGLEKREIHNKIQHFYVLCLAESGLRILVPVNKAEQVGLRPVSGKDEVAEVLAILRDKDVPLDRHTWNRRYRGFMDKIKSGSIFEVAEVLRDLHRLKRTKPLSFGERRMMDTAKELIVQELSVAQLTAHENVESTLALALAEGSAE
jgi:CarD family transcriptional regulator